MRAGKFIFILFLFCSLIAQVIGVQNASSCEYDNQVLHSSSSNNRMHINSFNFFDENIFDGIGEFGESETNNDRKVKKSFYQQLFFLGKMHFRYFSEYKIQKNASRTGKYSTSHLKHIILQL